MLVASNIVEDIRDNQRDKLKEKFNLNDETISIAYEKLHEALLKGVKKEIVHGNAFSVEQFFVERGNENNGLENRFREEFDEKVAPVTGLTGEKAENLRDTILPTILDALKYAFKKSKQDQNLHGVINFLQFENYPELIKELKHYLDEEIPEGGIGGVGRVTGQGHPPQGI